MSQGDIFYKLFLGDVVLGPQCQNQCKYKYDNSSADIRIGDLWGETYKFDEKGVSALVSFTERGRQIVEELKGISLVEHPFDVVAEGQMKKNAKAAPLRALMIYVLRSQPSARVIKSILFASRVLQKLNRVIGK